MHALFVRMQQAVLRWLQLQLRLLPLAVHLQWLLCIMMLPVTGSLPWSGLLAIQAPAGFSVVELFMLQPYASCWTDT